MRINKYKNIMLIILIINEMLIKYKNYLKNFIIEKSCIFIF